MKSQTVKLINEYSHDLKSPLAKIQAIVVIVKNTTIPKTRDQYLTRIEKAINTLNRNLENLFTFINIQEEEFKLGLRFFNIGKVLTDLKEKYNFSLMMQTDTQILADPDMLNMALEIYVKCLLDNKANKISLNTKDLQTKIIILINFQFSDGPPFSKTENLPLVLADEIINLHQGKIASSTKNKNGYLKITLNKNQKAD